MTSNLKLRMARLLGFHTYEQCIDYFETKIWEL